MLLFFFRKRKRLYICTNVIVFQEENETVDMYTNVINWFSSGPGASRHLYYCYCFFQEEKETVGMCTNVSIFFRRKRL